MIIGSSKNQGITLIETVVTVFIFSAGVASIVGTALFAFTIHDTSLLRGTAVGLAREGVEVVRSIRDSHWLPTAPQNVLSYCGNDDPSGSDLAPDQYCYKNWLDWFYALPVGTCGTDCREVQAVFSPNSSNWWSLANVSDYGLYLHPDSTYRNTNPGGDTATYYRKIKITLNPNEPYTPNHPEVQVVSTVAWVGRGCPPFGTDPENADPACKIVVEERLTNWKNY